MRTQIRRGVFETNSSSMHSVVVMKEDANKSTDDGRERMQFTEDGEWEICTDDCYFGRNRLMILNTVEEKARYAIASLCLDEDSEWFDQILEAVQTVFPECVDIRVPWNIPYAVGIDHQSSDMLMKFLTGEGITVKEFITDNRYIVTVDSDEADEFGDLIRIGMIDTEKIDHEYVWPPYRSGKDWK